MGTRFDGSHRAAPSTRSGGAARQRRRHHDGAAWFMEGRHAGRGDLRRCTPCGAWGRGSARCTTTIRGTSRCRRGGSQAVPVVDRRWMEMNDRLRLSGGNSTARSSTANAPAALPDGDTSSISNGLAGMSTRISTRAREASMRSRSSSFPPERMTSSMLDASRAVDGRLATATSRDGVGCAEYERSTGPSISIGGASSAHVPATTLGDGGA